MKYLLYIINIIIAILVFSSCKDENDDMPSGKDECYTILVSVPDGADTRAYYKEDGGDISVMWEKGDVIKVGDADFVFKEMQNGKALFYHYGKIDGADSWSGTISFNSDSNNQLQKKNNECREYLEANVTGINLNGSTTVELMPAEGKSLLHIQAKSPAMFLGGSTLKITGLDKEYTVTLGDNSEYVFADKDDVLNIYLSVPAGVTISTDAKLQFVFMEYSEAGDGDEYGYIMKCNTSVTTEKDKVLKMPLPNKTTRMLHLVGTSSAEIPSGSVLNVKVLNVKYSVNLDGYSKDSKLDFYIALSTSDFVKKSTPISVFITEPNDGDEYHFLNKVIGESESKDMVKVEIGTITCVAVQLGLPSGTKWANLNIGATTESDYGDYFAWGEIAPKTVFKNGNTSNYLLYNKADVDLMNEGILSPKVIPYDVSQVPYDTLVASYDAASQIWGNDWKMPSRTNLDELIAQTTRIGVTVNSVKGVSVTSKINSKSIFLPLAGYRDNVNSNNVINSTKQGHYWTSSPRNTNSRTESYKCSVSDKDISGYEASGRYKGFSIRPVRASN